jgi:hypothetical protein
MLRFLTFRLLPRVLPALFQNRPTTYIPPSIMGSAVTIAIIIFAIVIIFVATLTGVLSRTCRKHNQRPDPNDFVIRDEEACLHPGVDIITDPLPSAEAGYANTLQVGGAECKFLRKHLNMLPSSLHRRTHPERTHPRPHRCCQPTPPRRTPYPWWRSSASSTVIVSSRTTTRARR